MAFPIHISTIILEVYHLIYFHSIGITPNGVRIDSTSSNTNQDSGWPDDLVVKSDHMMLRISGNMLLHKPMERQ